MEAIGAISGLITVVEVSVRITRLCLAYSRDVKNASDDIQRLEQTVLHLRSTTESVLDLLQGPDNWRLQASQKLRQAAEDSKTRLDNLEERLQPSSTRGKFMRFGLSSLKWPFQKKDMDRLVTELSQCSQAISAALQVDQLNVQLQTSEDVANIDRGIRDLDRRALLDQLPVVHGAAYDSHAEEQNSVCLADTRVDYLHQILEWANAPDAETLLWLKGMAGTGKSTISRTIARSLAARGLLGANFFFKRGESDRSSVNKLFTTLAFQLSLGNRRIAQQVIAALKSDPALPNKATRDQFDKLILEPILLAYQGHEKSTLVVILDALDECEDHSAARNVINLFSQSRSLPSLKLRVFITSRPEVMIRLGFNEVTGSYRSLDLSDAPTITVEQDIARYFTSELARIRHEYNVRVAEDRRLDEDWPGQNRARDLIEMAIPLFIFAATVCRFLAEIRWEPDEQLAKILNYRALSQLSKLDATYTPVLDQLIEGLSEPEIEEVVGDFCEVFWVDKKAVHQKLAKCCLRLMSDLLHEDMCDLKVPGALRAAVDNQVISKCLTQELQYAVKHWTHHASEYKGDRQFLAQTLEFLKLHFLHWVESLSLLGQLPSIFEALKRSEILANFISDAPTDLADLIFDGTLFIRRFFEAVHIAPLQLYSSALIFAPQKSIIRQYSKIPPWIVVPPQMPSDWDPCVLIMAGHKRDVHMAIMSPDSKYIAACTSGKEIWIWDGETGLFIKKLEGHTNKVIHIAFSEDSKQIASYSMDKTIRLWDIESSTCLRQHNFPFLPLHPPTEPAVILQDSQLVARTRHEDQSFHIWRVDDGSLIEKIDTQGEEVGVLNTYNGKNTIISMGSNGKPRLWRTGQENLSQQFHAEEEVTMAALSVDSKLAAVSFGSMIRTWNIEPFECIGEYRGHEGLIMKMAFSPDSTLLVSGSTDSVICVWRVEDGACIRNIASHRHHITSLAFSSDSKMIISSSYDNTVRVWHALRDDKEAQSVGNCRSIYAKGVTKDLKLAISVSDTEQGSSDRSAIQFWSTDSGEFLDDIAIEGDRIIRVIMARDTKSLVAQYESRLIRIWSTESRLCTFEFSIPMGMGRFKLDDDSANLVGLFGDNTFRLFSLETGVHHKTIPIDENIWVKNFKLSSSTEFILYGFRNHYLMNTATGACDNLGPYEEDLSSGFQTDKARHWITWNGHRLLYLPLQYFWSAPTLTGRTTEKEAALIFNSENQLLVTKFSTAFLNGLLGSQY